jgi:hypothetical protein
MILRCKYGISDLMEYGVGLSDFIGLVTHWRWNDYSGCYCAAEPQRHFRSLPIEASHNHGQSEPSPHLISFQCFNKLNSNYFKAGLIGTRQEFHTHYFRSHNHHCKFFSAFGLLRGGVQAVQVTYYKADAESPRTR